MTATIDTRRLILQELKRRTKADKRRDPRIPINLPVEIRGFGNNRTHWNESSVTINISNGGLALRLSHKVIIGDTIYVELHVPEKIEEERLVESYRGYAIVRNIDQRNNVRPIVRL